MAMVANRLATGLHRGTHRMAAILAYAALEWTLIVLLLLNGVFAYLIARFAACFGLKPPCVFCSRVDHLFEPGRRRRGRACRDLICDDHAAEVAGLGYCARHRRLAEAGEMCEDCCASSRPTEAAVLSWMKRSEGGEKDLRCSCCDVVLESGFYSPFLLFKPSWGALEYDQKENLVDDIAVGDCEDSDKNFILREEKVEERELLSPDQVDRCSEIDKKEGVENKEKVRSEERTFPIISEREVEEETLIHLSDACYLVDDASVLTRNLGNMYDEERLVPIELIDSTTMTKSPVFLVLGKQDQLGHVREEEDGQILDIGSISEEKKDVDYTAERTDLVEQISSGHGRVEHVVRAFDIRNIIEEEKGLLSASEMADIVEVNPLGNPGLEQVIDVGCIREEEKALTSAATGADIVEEIFSKDVLADQHVNALDVRSVVEEENVLISAGERVNPIEDKISDIDETQQCVLTPDMRSVLDEETAVASAGERADATEDNSSEMEDVQQCAMNFMPEGTKALVSANEKADTIEENSQQCALALDKRSAAEVERAFFAGEERTDTIEENFSEMNHAQQCAATLDLRGILEDEKALAAAEERDKTIEEDSSVMNDAQQIEITLDMGNVSSEEKKLVSRTEGDDIAEQNSAFDHQFIAPQATSISNIEDGVVVQVGSIISPEDLPGTEEHNKFINMEADCEISIGSEICDQENINHTHQQQILMSKSTQDQLSESYNEMTIIDQEIFVSGTEPVVTTARSPDHIIVFPGINENEEERAPETAPETPTYIDGIHGLNKRFLLGRRETGTESVDGSVASEFEGCEILTVDQLKTALKAERKALSALYAELEEERSASAVAANQTMAMITRLQQEKAAMQMEALQYQRMMEEQSEYDQEALQLLNELMMKREKEKQDLEKELEVYRRKVLSYKAKERRQMAKHTANGRIGTSSASSSEEDSDDLSFESHEGEEFVYNPNESNQNTPADDVSSSGTDQGTAKYLITLKESLADFEEERLSILEQLKALERKLITLDDEDPDDLEILEHIPDANGRVSNGNYEPLSDDSHNVLNGFSDNFETSKKLHHERRGMGCKGKSLLPLFDAISNENEDDVCTKEVAIDASLETISNLVEEQKKLAIVEEVDNIYERLDALEGNREFLKHCINSLKKGDKGILLLQEILEHLRDLRSVELRARHSYDALASLSA